MAKSSAWFSVLATNGMEVAKLSPSVMFCNSVTNSGNIVISWMTDMFLKSASLSKLLVVMLTALPESGLAVTVMVGTAVPERSSPASLA